MTIQEISQLPYVSIEIIDGKFNRLTVSDDHYITAYVDGQDIKNYTGANLVCLPISDSNIFPEYRVITKAQHEEYERRRDDTEPELND